jgi:hypothetical protein
MPGGHVDVPMQVRHYFFRSIEQLEKAVDRFFELPTSAGP